MPVTVPPVIRDYRLTRRVGSGAFGEVWLAQDLTGLPRAVKVLKPAQEGERRELAGVRRVQSLMRWHPHLCPVWHVGKTEEDRMYYVMPLADNVSQVEGEYAPDTLEHRLSAGALPLEEVLKIARQLADGLHFLHQHQLLHRDIKPANVIFCGGEPLIADVGLVGGRESQTHSVMGTLPYLPPELAASAGSDTYALCKVVYQMATGQPVTAFPQWPSTLLNHREAERYLQLNDLLCRACALEPRRRFQDAGELLVALEGLASQPTAHHSTLSAKVLLRLLLALLIFVTGFVLGAWGK